MRRLRSDGRRFAAGPSDRRACSIASGTSSRPMITGRRWASDRAVPRRRRRACRTSPVASDRHRTGWSHPLRVAVGDVQRVAGVPAAGAVDPSTHELRLDSTISVDQARQRRRIRTSRPEPRSSRSARTSRKTSNGDLLGGIDHDVRAELVARQLASFGLEVGHDDRLDAPTGQCGDRGKADGACADDDRHLTGLHVGGAHVELADRERSRSTAMASLDTSPSTTLAIVGDDQ